MAIQTSIEENGMNDTEVVSSAIETTDFTPKNEETVEEQNISVIDGQTKEKITEKINFWVSKSVYDTIKERATFERRTQTTVVIEMCRTFLNETKYEPRPYLPVSLRAEKMEIKVSYALPRDMALLLKERANCEGRTPTTLFIAAVFRYVNENPIPEAE